MNEETGLQTTNGNGSEMSLEQVKGHVDLVQQVMQGIMIKDEHYGTIPGTGKPSLYKSGAEKLSLTFRLSPTYDIRRGDLPNGHREYEIVCTLQHIPTGEIFGQGVGSCSTMEAKYRFRTGEVEFTGQPVPQAYWDNRDNRLLGGAGFRTKKNPDTGKWEIVLQGERVEHDNPADYYNTVLKMAKKRAQVDATLTCTAASDIFTQDVEDLPAEPQKTPESPPERNSENGGNGNPQPPQGSASPLNEGPGNGTDNPKAEICALLRKMNNGDDTKAADQLEKVTTFPGKNGTVQGKRTTEGMSDRQAEVTLGKVRKLHDAWSSSG
jgi:hypothetical protein